MAVIRLVGGCNVVDSTNIIAHILIAFEDIACPLACAYVLYRVANKLRDSVIILIFACAICYATIKWNVVAYMAR